MPFFDVQEYVIENGKTVRGWNAYVVEADRIGDVEKAFANHAGAGRFLVTPIAVTTLHGAVKDAQNRKLLKRGVP